MPEKRFLMGILLCLGLVVMMPGMGCDDGGGGHSDGDSDGDTDSDTDSDTDTDSDSDSDTDTDTDSDSDGDCTPPTWGTGWGIGQVVPNWAFTGYADADKDGAVEQEEVSFTLEDMTCAGYESVVLIIGATS